MAGSHPSSRGAFGMKRRGWEKCFFFSKSRVALLKLPRGGRSERAAGSGGISMRQADAAIAQQQQAMGCPL